MPTYERISGQPIKSRWGQWYRHDKILADGVELEGFVQVRRRYCGKRIGHRIESTTCFRNTCVQGADFNWLLRQQESTPATK